MAIARTLIHTMSIQYSNFLARTITGQGNVVFRIQANVVSNLNKQSVIDSVLAVGVVFSAYQTK